MFVWGNLAQPLKVHPFVLDFGCIGPCLLAGAALWEPFPFVSTLEVLLQVHMPCPSFDPAVPCGKRRGP